MQLGVTYRRLGQLEQSVKIYRNVATIFQELDDGAAEGVMRGNLAYALFELRHYDDARREIRRAIQCKAGLGHAAEPWKAFGVLSLVERAAGNIEAAAVARQQAIDNYLAYRRDGGENTSELRELIASVAAAMKSGDVASAATALENHATRTDLPSHWKAVVLQLLAMVRGERREIADDLELDDRDAVELQLLLNSVDRSPNG